MGRIDRSSFVDFKVTLLYCLILDIMTTLEDLRDVNQSKWTNTVTAFKRQHTMLTTLLTEVKQITKDMVDPRKKVNGKTAKTKVDPIKRKVEILDKYVESLQHKLGTMNFEVYWRKSVFGRTIKRRILKI